MKIIFKIRDLIRWCIRSLCADLLEDIIHMNEYCLSTAFMHRETFLPFKNKHNGQEIVIVATGPSLNDYKPIPGAVHIGVNMSVKNDKVNLDYLFLQDCHERTKDELEAIINYRPSTCIKFFGLSSILNNTTRYPASESDTIRANARRYRTDNLWEKRIEKRHYFQLDISTQPLADFGTVVFSALQFALWTNPKRIYLVGCDCSNLGHFNDPKTNTTLDGNFLKLGYEKFKEFALAYYPNTEIISVNPVGLKGLFKDLEQN